MYERFEYIADRWIDNTDRYSEEQFLRKPDDLQWSVGQVYVHLIQSTNQFHLRQIHQCVSQQGIVMRGGKKLPGVIAFMMGMFPPVRIHVPPSPSYTPVQPINKHDVIRQLQELKKSVKAALPEVEKASPRCKTEHPALGYLNAREWFQLIPMHFHHHRRQQSRLNTFLADIH